MDNMLIVGQDVSKINNIKKELNKCFAIKDLEPVK